jgi:RNA polymerase-binding transcription factor DksA
MDEKVLEIAEAVTQATVENGVAKIRAQVRKRDPLFDGACEECGDPIPDPRLDTGATTCLECQQTLERIQAQFKR